MKQSAIPKDLYAIIQEMHQLDVQACRPILTFEHQRTLLIDGTQKTLSAFLAENVRYQLITVDHFSSQEQSKRTIEKMHLAGDYASKLACRYVEVRKDYFIMRFQDTSIGYKVKGTVYNGFPVSMTATDLVRNPLQAFAEGVDRALSYHQPLDLFRQPQRAEVVALGMLESFLNEHDFGGK